MKKIYWTSVDIRKLFHIDERHKSIQTLYNAEERGEIPKAIRSPRGKIQVRNWTSEQIPSIGRKFGFLQPPSKQIIICKYIQKGGVLKTTSSFYEAKTFALNGIKTLIIGLDYECSITDILLPRQKITRLDEAPKLLGLYHLLVENAPIKKVIQKTPLPTLDIIPETHDLVVLDKWLAQQKRREYLFSDNLIPMLQDYEVIIFDNGPSWNHLIENSIVCSHTVICPLGCTLLAYNASETNLASLFEFQEVMKLQNQKIVMFSTLLDHNSLSQQINAQYLSKFSDYIIPVPIRKSVKGEEALVNQQTILEYAPTSTFADEYYQLILAIWATIVENKSINDISQNLATIVEK